MKKFNFYLKKTRLKNMYKEYCKLGVNAKLCLIDEVEKELNTFFKEVKKQKYWK